jgi:hypothetical protein
MRGKKTKNRDIPYKVWQALDLQHEKILEMQALRESLSDNGFLIDLFSAEAYEEATNKIEIGINHEIKKYKGILKSYDIAKETYGSF